MRILFVNRMASMVRGGGETFDLEMARHLEARGAITTFLTGLPLVGSATSPLERPRVVNLRTPYTGGLAWDKLPGGWRLRLADFWWFEKAAARWFLRQPGAFDIVQVCELPVFVRTLKDRHCPVPVSMRLTAPDYHDALGAVQAADLVVASGATLDRMRSGARPDCLDVPNGVDVERFRPQASSFRDEHGISRAAFVALSVARFQSVKNHPMLLNAFRRVVDALPDAVLLLAGSGPGEGSAREVCRSLRLEHAVRFLGEVPYDRLPGIYAAADAGVISSDYESFCFAALEAMATALPIVTTDTDWVPRLIQRGEGGYVVPIGDGEALARALVDLARDHSKRHSMGAWNRRRVERDFGWDESARKLFGAYEAVLAGHRKQDNGCVPRDASP